MVLWQVHLPNTRTLRLWTRKKWSTGNKTVYRKLRRQGRRLCKTSWKRMPDLSWKSVDISQLSKSMRRYYVRRHITAKINSLRLTRSGKGLENPPLIKLKNLMIWAMCASRKTLRMWSRAYRHLKKQNTKRHMRPILIFTEPCRHQRKSKGTGLKSSTFQLWKPRKRSKTWIRPWRKSMINICKQ